MSNDEQPYIEVTVTETVRAYNPKYGDDRLCVCGHPYYRHFDSFAPDVNATRQCMEPVGCKYCGCDTFREASGPLREDQHG